jgi:competence protein ComEA
VKFLNNLAVKLGITRAEMIAVTLLTFFLLLGGAIKYGGAMQDADKAVRKAEAARYSEAEVDSLLALAMNTDEQNVTDVTGKGGKPDEARERQSKPESSRNLKKKLTGTIAFNSASVSQLQMISGIGPVMAKRLVDFRKLKGGRISSFKELLEVKGIGTKKLDILKKHLTLD